MISFCDIINNIYYLLKNSRINPILSQYISFLFNVFLKYNSTKVVKIKIVKK